MSTKSPSESDAQPGLDDGYWQSLFRDEESLARPTTPPLSPTDDHEWQSLAGTLASRIDGRFQWSDGGKPADSDIWGEAQAIYDRDETLELKVTGFNKGGLLVQWHTLQGFVPASQLNNFPHFHLKSARLQELKNRQDQSIRLKIIELDATNNRFILSERAATVKATERETLLARLTPGTTCQGRVTNLTHFGAFVDLGGVEGLIHISELAWSRVEHPSRIVRPEQIVTVLVLDVDSKSERIALSLKQLRTDPWANIESRYQVDQVVEGTVSNIVNFGVFVQLEPDLEGLVHISELAEGVFFHPRNVVSMGDKVTARILEVNGTAKRLALSMRLNQDTE